MRRPLALALSMCLGLGALAGCSAAGTAQTDTAAQEETSETTTPEETAETTETVETTTTTESSTNTASAIDNTVNLAEDYDSLLKTVEDHLTTATYHSDQYNLDIPYGLYVPEGYDASQEYPLVMFIPDSSLVGKSVEDILTQGYGAVVWASDAVQTGNPCLILIPAYPEMTVDDHSGYTITDYVPATPGLIDEVKSSYSIDENRIYTTGQSMGCMISMILASENPDLFAACMFVDGQWDPSTLAPLADQTFCYFAAHDDTSAYEGMQSAIPVWKENGAEIVEAEWDGEWDHDQLQQAAQEMLQDPSKIYCIVWEEGTIQPKDMGGPSGGSGGSGPSGMVGNGPSGDSSGMGGPSGDSSSGGNAMGSVGYHMASFDYAYKCNTMVAWLLAQTK